jgi:hypothetical protein
MCQGQVVVALVHKRKEKGKPEKLAEKEGSNQAKISAVGMGLA